MSKRVALYEAASASVHFHHATQTFGLCAVVLPQVKAAGLVQTFGLPLSPGVFSGNPYCLS